MAERPSIGAWWAATALALVSGAALRLQGLGSAPPTESELRLGWRATRAELPGLLEAATTALHPPLVDLAMWVWLAGQLGDDAALRLPGALAGCASLGLLALAAHAHRGAPTMAALTWLAALNPWLVASDRRAGAAPWLMLLTVGVAAALLAGPRDRSRHLRPALFGAGVGLLGHVHLLGPPIGLVALGLAARHPRLDPAARARWLLAGCFGAATWLVWLPVLGAPWWASLSTSAALDLFSTTAHLSLVPLFVLALLAAAVPALSGPAPASRLALAALCALSLGLGLTERFQGAEAQPDHRAAAAQLRAHLGPHEAVYAEPHDLWPWVLGTDGPPLHPLDERPTLSGSFWVLARWNGTDPLPQATPSPRLDQAPPRGIWLQHYPGQRLAHALDQLSGPLPARSWTADELHIFEEAEVVGPWIQAQGPCAAWVAGRSDRAGDSDGWVRLRLENEDGALVEDFFGLPHNSAERVGQAVPLGQPGAPVRVRATVAFTNDALVEGETGWEDRNVHLRGVGLVCD